MRTPHLIRPGGALLALLALSCLAGAARVAVAQDSIATHRHVLALDMTRVRPFTRSYDMVVHVGDSAHVIGQRDVVLTESAYAGQPAWLVVESRSGIVASLDSLVLAADLRPVHWSSGLGRSRFGAELSGDSIFGATVTPSSRRSIILGNRPDLVVSTAMLEVIAGLLPLSGEWSDSAALLAVDAADASVIPAELAITGTEQGVGGDTAGAWLMAVRTDRGQLQLWIEKTSGTVARIEQPLPSHVGSRLEYRPRTAPMGAMPPE